MLVSSKERRGEKKNGKPRWGNGSGKWKRWEKDKEVNRKMGRAFELKVKKRSPSFTLWFRRGEEWVWGWGESFWIAEKGEYNGSSTPKVMPLEEWQSYVCPTKHVLISLPFLRAVSPPSFSLIYITETLRNEFALRWQQCEWERWREKALCRGFWRETNKIQTAKKEKAKRKYKEKIHFAEHEGM